MATTLARSISSSNGHGGRHEASTTSPSSSSSTASAQKRRGESQQQAAVVPATPGPALQFLASPAHHHHTQTQLVAPRRSVPSKWEDAEKWLRQSSSSSSSSGSDHHHHLYGNARAAFSRQRSGGLGHRGGAGGGGDEKKSAAVAVRRSVDALRDAHSLALYAAPAAEVLLKDKFTDNEEPSKESFVFRSSCCCEAAEPAKGAAAADGRQRRRDVGTEMTPLGSSCHTPLKSASPARHNTPASRSSGPLVPYTAGGGGGTDISELAGFRLAKLDLGARFGAHATLVGWSSKEEEDDDEDVSKSLRHFEATVGGTACDRRGGDCRWDDDDRAKSCIRYQREEAKIQAWVNLESAKAEAQSRKLEVKIQKMRCNLEEKLMQRMTTVQRRAGEWRATARAQHLQQLRRAAAHGAGRRLRATSTSTAHHRHLPGCSSDAPSCACFPCSTSTSGGGGGNNVVSGGLLSYY